MGVLVVPTFPFTDGTEADAPMPSELDPNGVLLTLATLSGSQLVIPLKPSERRWLAILADTLRVDLDVVSNTVETVGTLAPQDSLLTEEEEEDDEPRILPVSSGFAASEGTLVYGPPHPSNITRLV